SRIVAAIDVFRRWNLVKLRQALWKYSNAQTAPDFRSLNFATRLRQRSCREEYLKELYTVGHFLRSWRPVGRRTSSRSSPIRVLEIVQPRVVGIARSIPIHLEMNAETVGACPASWIERFIDRVGHAVVREGLKHSI